MYHPTTRVLTVLELLQARGRMGGPELAARLEVSARSLRRYITMLQDLGVPIEAERGRHGGYRLRPGYKLPPLMFSEDEALALTLGLRAARDLGLTGGGAAVEGALAKVERVLPAAVQGRVRAVGDALTLDTVGQAWHAPPPASAVVVALGEAAREGRRALLRYRDWRAAETERVVDPYGLVYHGGRWFAVGHCHLRGDVRVFRLDRVRGAEARGDHFERPHGFDCAAHVRRTLATTPGAWTVEVLLRTTLDDARRIVPPALATLDEVAGGVALRCNVQRLDWLAHFLAGLCCPLVVRAPDELREALRRLAAHASALADAREGIFEQDIYARGHTTRGGSGARD